ncbi:MAG: virulence-associated E family protein, partial [Clostridia bacterium]|nr:virulence-associated E family protein [Clostridia bacterium]
MKNDRQIIISIGNSRNAVVWKAQQLSVSDLYVRLQTPQRSTETYAEYMRLKKVQQDTLKDVGGFVGGAFKGTRRKAQDVAGRDLSTLDYDNIPGWQTDAVIQKVEELGCSYCVYSTRKHSPAAPRLRIIIPLDRTVTADEYEPCARRVAASIGIHMADPTTFDVNRLMYWPSCSSDGSFAFKTKDAPFISADFLLGTYGDWHDMLQWPQALNAVSYAKLATKQGDPLTKNGVVGAFCRTYDINQAIEAFLPNVYEEVENSDGRYTYLGGSTTGGAVLYDDGKFLYSHHATDPCSGKLVNAFDLIRLHKFADDDDNCAPDLPILQRPSYKNMCDFALRDKKTVATLNREKAEEAAKDFEGLERSDGDMNWAEKLQRKQNGEVKGTIDNVLIILEGDPLLKDKFALNLFANRGEVKGALPWQSSVKRRLWTDNDNNGLYWYLERYWGIVNRQNIDSALDVHATQHAFNEVQDYINGLKWDGVERLDTLFIDYLGAQDTEYNRAVCRKCFTAAIARAMEPGCKYDNMLILAGPQGIGKSTLLDKMSCGWFNDSIRTFEGKEASELLQGVWLVEISELDAFRRTDVARIKQFLSLRADRYRAAYGRHVKEVSRCCVFFGTTNTAEFLQDTTGNRRFWPVDVGIEPHSKNVWDDLSDAVIAQLWAEAKVRWQAGEPLYLTGEIENQAREKQEKHREVSAWEGMILEFADRPIPSDWQKWNLDRRRDFWAGAIKTAANGKPLQTEPRTRITAIEIWCELLNGNIRDLKRSEASEINAVLRKMDGWSGELKTVWTGPY